MTIIAIVKIALMYYWACKIMDAENYNICTNLYFKFCLSFSGNCSVRVLREHCIFTKERYNN